MPPETVEERLAKIETTLGHIHETWKTHVVDENDYHEKLDGKVEQLLLAQARDEGERKAVKRLAGYVALAVSGGISMVAVVVNYFF